MGIAGHICTVIKLAEIVGESRCYFQNKISKNTLSTWQFVLIFVIYLSMLLSSLISLAIFYILLL